MDADERAVHCVFARRVRCLPRCQVLDLHAHPEEPVTELIGADSHLASKRPALAYKAAGDPPRRRAKQPDTAATFDLQRNQTLAAGSRDEHDEVDGALHALLPRGPQLPFAFE